MPLFTCYEMTRQNVVTKSL